MSAPSPSFRPDYSFASDNAAGLTPEALAALTAANDGTAASYGDDPWSARARKLFNEIFETECEVFFVFNGTAANALVLSQFCRSYHSIVCHESSHVDVDECGAPEYFTGGSKVLTVGGAAGKLTPAALEPIWTRGHGVHYPKAGALSLTQSTELGTVYTPEEIRALADVAQARGLAVHMDGARFSNAMAALAARGVRPADATWRAGIDALCFGGTKNGMNTTEAVVFFHPGRAREFEYRVKQAGQLASKMRFAAAQWVAMLEGGAWLRHAAHANAMARRLTNALRLLPRLKLIAEPEVNAVFVELPPRLAETMAARGWHFYRFIGEHGYRLMCSWATTPETIERFVAEIRAALGTEEGR